MNPTTPPPSRPEDDVDAEFARLLAEHHQSEHDDVRTHVRTCACCNAIAVVIGNLRRDLWELAERRAA
jgi:hypothetical protein